MTIQELNEFRVIRAEIRALDGQIKDLLILKTSGGNEVGAGRVSARMPTSQTEQNAIKLSELMEKLEREKERLLDFQIRVAAWMEEIDDPEVKAIVRFRYILGMSWRQVNWEMGNRLDRQFAYHKLRRYIERKM